ncbi:hypothetical protein EYF80_049244 [Liparis tanakae]|uniref:Uncharacterized protein n=1 Tax=Liparis tanakae TaxID=230148 RepID=A0A4Z2FI25_9TELE|nr:hypothetical protein EYF80_049244 [Liparis tanakae]
MERVLLPPPAALLLTIKWPMAGSAVMASFWKVLACTSSSSSFRSFCPASSSSSSSRLCEKRRTVMDQIGIGVQPLRTPLRGQESGNSPRELQLKHDRTLEGPVGRPEDGSPEGLFPPGDVGPLECPLKTQQETSSASYLRCCGGRLRGGVRPSGSGDGDGAPHSDGRTVGSSDEAAAKLPEGSPRGPVLPVWSQAAANKKVAAQTAF